MSFLFDMLGGIFALEETCHLLQFCASCGVFGSDTYPMDEVSDG